MKTKEELRLYFENGDKPVQEHFWQWQDSYWHKGEKINMENISGLENGVPSPNHIYAEINQDGAASLKSYFEKKIFIKPGTKTIPDNFAYYLSLTEAFLPEGIDNIGVSAFMNNKLTSINIPKSITDIGVAAFQYNQLTSVSIPKSITEINNNVFADNQLTSVDIPESVIKIGVSAFSANLLQSVIIPKSVTDIENNAFGNNTLTSIYIPSSVSNIGEYAFAFNQLTEVTLGENTSYRFSSFDSAVKITGGKLIS
ncbi:hypothetical protein M2347_001522 [Chryseobacterium sp. H1D6B]|uniref:leucine-rich repeat domain-containing protein n=1 Tax=Chryseobacterium sp. H1D6B TaxID=2940588 RepID=UPI0015C76719|nr:leucine-rich repeat domain-containing protein [Chryseobacterium sp. H1D6B]MDH6251795.1 hypothetical protein [Chryseobacterium sp. H1D6B]